MTQAEWRQRELLIIQYRNQIITRAEFIARWTPLYMAAMEALDD